MPLVTVAETKTVLGGRRLVNIPGVLPKLESVKVKVSFEPTRTGLEECVPDNAACATGTPARMHKAINAKPNDRRKLLSGPKENWLYFI